MIHVKMTTVHKYIKSVTTVLVSSKIVYTQHQTTAITQNQPAAKHYSNEMNR